MFGIVHFMLLFLVYALNDDFGTPMCSFLPHRPMGGGTGGYRGYMYPPPFLEGGYKRVHSVKVCVYPVVR